MAQGAAHSRGEKIPFQKYSSYSLKEKKENEKRRVGGDRRGLGEQDKATVKRERVARVKEHQEVSIAAMENELKMYVTCCAWLNDRI